MSVREFERGERGEARQKAAEFLITGSNYLVLGTVNSYRRRSSYREDSAIPNATADAHLVYANEAEANGRAEPDVWGADENSAARQPCMTL